MAGSARPNPLAAGAALGVRRAERIAWFGRLSLDEPEAMRHLLELAAALRDSRQLETLLSSILDGALALTGAQFGNVLLIDPASGLLVLVAQSGFEPVFTDHLAFAADEHSAAGRATRSSTQTVIEDVTTDPDYGPHQGLAAAVGFRAVQATPLVDFSGRLVGVVATHWRRPGRPPDRDLRPMELFGEVAGEAITRRLGPTSRALADSGSAAPPPSAADRVPRPRDEHP